jgi:NhaP-type Na+/H+ or K+/H+ antiporter
MAAMVAMLAAVGVFALGLALGAAVLLGAILAPTDPVLASGCNRSQATTLTASASAWLPKWPE